MLFENRIAIFMSMSLFSNPCVVRLGRSLNSIARETESRTVEWLFRKIVRSPLFLCIVSDLQLA